MREGGREEGHDYTSDSVLKELCLLGTESEELCDDWYEFRLLCRVLMITVKELQREGEGGRERDSLQNNRNQRVVL